MVNNIRFLHKGRSKGENIPPNSFGVKNAAKARKFHESFPDYSATPLRELRELSNYLGVNRIYIKDESCRFGLNAFKALGGTYCIGRYIASQLEMDIEELSYQKLKSKAVKDHMGDITFVTATDGNHGKGIAWAAKELGYKSVVYLPKGSATERLNSIAELGAEAYITDLNYDDTVRFAKAQAEKEDWVLLQDTAWEGYEEIPRWIMEGYTTLGHEITEQLKGREITHIFLQAGVGSMAGALTGFFADYYGEKERPIITIVEPNKADCVFRTAGAKDGTLQIVTGGMDTIMAGLACGEVCTLGWEILKNYGDNFVSVPDVIAAKGMRILGNPLTGDNKVISGESGAVTLGFVSEVMKRGELWDMKKKLGLDGGSKILCISTEGDTDRKNYRKIVWDGFYPSFSVEADNIN